MSTFSYVPYIFERHARWHKFTAPPPNFPLNTTQIELDTMIDSSISDPSQFVLGTTLSDPSYPTTLNTDPYFTTLTSPPPSSSPSLCTCTVNNDCATCPGNPNCLNGTCQVCNPNSQITSDSSCYSKNLVCSTDSTGNPICTPCKTTAECQQGYGNNFSCNNGKCSVVSSPEEPSINWWLIIGLIVAIIAIIIFGALIIYYILRRNKTVLSSEIDYSSVM